jgi:hypothetical protein
VIREKTAGGDVFVYFKHEESGKGPEFGRLLMVTATASAPCACTNLTISRSAQYPS